MFLFHHLDTKIIDFLISRWTRFSYAGTLRAFVSLPAFFHRAFSFHFNFLSVLALVFFLLFLIFFGLFREQYPYPIFNLSFCLWCTCALSHTRFSFRSLTHTRSLAFDTTLACSLFFFTELSLQG